MSIDELRPWGFVENELVPLESARKGPAARIMSYGGTDFPRLQEELGQVHIELAVIAAVSASKLPRG